MRDEEDRAYGKRFAEATQHGWKARPPTARATSGASVEEKPETSRHRIARRELDKGVFDLTPIESASLRII